MQSDRAEALAADVGLALARYGTLAEWQLNLLLRAAGHEGLSRQELARALENYEGTRFERQRTRSRRDSGPAAVTRWRLTPYAVRFVPELAAVEREKLHIPPPALSLWPWQREALTAWRNRGRRGVVQAVTGAGKTRVGVMAAFEQLCENSQVTILVPRVVLVRQWAEQLRTAMPGVNVQERHGTAPGHATAEVLVTTIQSAVRDKAVLARRGLLIADECHRYGADTFALGLFKGCSVRLGLTATYDRLDDGITRYLDPYFGGVCFLLSYERAVPEAIVAPFTVAVVKVALTGTEHGEYVEAQEEAKAARQLLIRLGAPEKPFGEFLKKVAGWAREEATDQVTLTARRYMRAFSEVRGILAWCSAKFDVLAELRPAIDTAHGTLVFTQRIDAAELACDVLWRQGVRAEAIHSAMAEADRQRMFDRFERGYLKAVVAVQVLDEGIDLPEADLAIVMAGTKVERQMIQRMGRVLRRKKDGRVARFALLVAAGTSEDPLSGGHEGFLRKITDVAVAVRPFRSNEIHEAVRLLSTLELPEAYAAALASLSGLSDTELELLAQLSDTALDLRGSYQVARRRFPRLVDALIGADGVELDEGESIRISGAILADITRLGSMLKQGRQESRLVSVRHDVAGRALTRSK